MEFDLVIRGGTVVDGSGAPGVRADVAIRDGKIVEVGAPHGDAKRTLEADGRVVAPGFVDIHTHYDAQVFWDRMLSISPWHGVTTVVMGNCGFGVAPTRPEHRGMILRTLEKVEGMSLEALEAGLGEQWPFETFPEFLSAIEARGTAINVGALLGHTPLRLYVMGEDAIERKATDEEIARMRAVVRESVSAGALGFATSKSPTHVGFGGRPVPSRAAELSEIVALARELGALRRGVVQATFGPELFLEEFAEIARESGRPLSWTALLTGMTGPNAHRPVLERTEALQRENVMVYPQVTCRPLNFEFQWKEPFIFESMSIFKPVSAADADGKARLYRDPEFRRVFKERAGLGGRSAFAGRWARTWISVAPNAPELEERTVAEVAAERGADPVDVALDLALASNLEARFRMAVLNTEEADVEEVLKHPTTMIGLSDAGAHASQLCDACYSTSFLEKWVREKQAFTLEQGVHMLTARTAEIFGIHDRGRLAPGFAGDVVVFDPETVGAGKLRRVHDMPAGADRLVSDATGIHAVVVNGTVIREDGRDALDPSGALPGQVVRSRADRDA